MASELFWKTDPQELAVWGPSNDNQDQTLAALWKAQVDAFDSIPQHYPERTRVKFSPSGSTKCLRELYYANMNAPQDTEPSNPWKRRMARNGTAFHDGIQKDYSRMAGKLKELGLDVYFEPVEWELTGEKTISVNLDGKSYDVVLSGRCDGMLRYIGEVIPGIIEHGEVILLEFKSKDKLTNLKKVAKLGAQDDHKAQVISYSLIWGIDTSIIHYEALQKPKWSEPADALDWSVWQYKVSEMDKRTLLRRLATVVKHVEEGTLPPAETSKCAFCPFKGQCAKDGGYSG